MNYNEIYKPMSRTSFASKMMHAFYASISTMSNDGQVGPDILRTIFLPDEIETFVLFSITANEYSNKDMTEKQFVDTMSAIRSFQPPEFYEKLKTDHGKWILATIGAVQFESQEYAVFRLYRHHFLFSYVNENVNVDKEFKSKFVRCFDEYAIIAYTLHILLAQKEIEVFKEYCKRICSIAPWFIDNLKLNRDQYREELSQFATCEKDYKYCLRPSYSYPFIEYQDEYFLPTPHLLIQSITTAMMNRLTFGYDALRERIGKNACEDYLMRIVSRSGLFDEVQQEYTYAEGKRTLDVLARRKDVALLFDSKLFSPKVGLRTYDEEAYAKDIKRIVKEMKQAYLHGRCKFGHVFVKQKV